MIWRLVFIPSVSYQPFAHFASKRPIRLSVIASVDGAMLMQVTGGLLGGSASGFPECAHLANRRRAGPEMIIPQTSDIGRHGRCAGFDRP